MSRSHTLVKLGLLVDQLRSAPLNYIGDLTLTFPGIQPSQLPDLQRNLQLFRSAVLSRQLHTRGLAVMGRSPRSGVYHLHCLVDFSQDLSTGFDWSSLEEFPFCS